MLGRVALRRPVVFEVASSPLPFWVLDFHRRAVYRLSAPPPDTASIVTVNEAVLDDAIDKHLVHVVHGSMRLRVHLRPGGAGDDLTFWGLIVPWELGYLPLRRTLGRRLLVGHRGDGAANGSSGSTPLAAEGSASLFERLASRFAPPQPRRPARNATAVDVVG